MTPPGCYDETLLSQVSERDERLCIMWARSKSSKIPQHYYDPYNRPIDKYNLVVKKPMRVSIGKLIGTFYTT